MGISLIDWETGMRKWTRVISHKRWFSQKTTKWGSVLAAIKVGVTLWSRHICDLHGGGGGNRMCWSNENTSTCLMWAQINMLSHEVKTVLSPNRHTRTWRNKIERYSADWICSTYQSWALLRLTCLRACRWWSTTSQRGQELACKTSVTECSLRRHPCRRVYEKTTTNNCANREVEWDWRSDKERMWWGRS